MEKALKKYSPIFVLPTLLAFIIGFIIPFAEGLYLSFCQFTTVKNAKWVGLANYKRVFADQSFVDSLGFTVAFAVAAILLINVIAFGLALLLTRKLKGTNIFRTVFFMPNLIGGIVLGYIWQILINCVLSIVGQPLLALNKEAG
ncbi:MAG: sugar ABC transporter permease, partial [Lachnospiraceae bacterium]|nr:sugar ABC transporter permease [Lachnospiraceae bacterium]